MSAAENPFSAFIELMRKQAETVARPAWGWGEVVGTDPLSVMYNGVRLRPAQIVGAESLQGAAVGKRFPLIADADGQSFAVLGEQSGAPAWDEIMGKPTAFTPDDHDHAVADITDFPSTMPPSEHNHDSAYLGITAKAADSDQLDGNHASAFASSSHPHGNITAEGKVGATAGMSLITGAGGLVEAKKLWVGGENVWDNGDFESGIAGWSAVIGGEVLTHDAGGLSGKCLRIGIPQHGSLYYGAFRWFLNVDVGVEYTFSCDLKAYFAGRIEDNFGGITEFVSDNSKFIRYSHTFAPTGATGNIRILGNPSANYPYYLYVDNVKLEKGNTPTGFSPASREVTLMAYPVGTVYMSSVNISPAGLFGGTWAVVTPPTGMYAWKRTA